MGKDKLLRLPIDIEKFGASKNANAVMLYVHFLSCACTEDKEVCGVYLKRGQLLTSRKKINETTGLSDKEIRVALAKLLVNKLVEVYQTSRFSVVTICNYDCYTKSTEANETAKGQQKGQQNFGASIVKSINYNEDENKKGQQKGQQATNLDSDEVLNKTTPNYKNNIYYTYQSLYNELYNNIYNNIYNSLTKDILFNKETIIKRNIKEKENREETPISVVEPKFADISDEKKKKLESFRSMIFSDTSQTREKICCQHNIDEVDFFKLAEETLLDWELNDKITPQQINWYTLNKNIGWKLQSNAVQQARIDSIKSNAPKTKQQVRDDRLRSMNEIYKQYGLRINESGGLEKIN